ncbi:DMT family transporter [Streptomyces sp. NPDC051636]|uniref:DMT family transporter n=1 Tax=Streptomyces sp. NPDC051636 TaxID=3365663 RepID=UPI0037B31327
MCPKTTDVIRNEAEAGGSSRRLGYILLLLGGPARAGRNVLGKRASAGQDAAGVTYHQILAGAAGFLLASLLEADDWRIPGASASSLPLYLAVACSVGGCPPYDHGLRRMASSVTVNILHLVPVFGAIGAVVINGESIRLAQVTCGVIIIVGVALGMIERGQGAAARPDARGSESSGTATARTSADAGPVPDEPEAAVPTAHRVIDRAT